MSWSGNHTGPASNAESVVGAAAEAAKKQVESWDASMDAAKKASVEQIDAVAQAAVSIVNSGVVAGQGKQVYVGLSGHANPNHEPASGYANDEIYISIKQV